MNINNDYENIIYSKYIKNNLLFISKNSNPIDNNRNSLEENSYLSDKQTIECKITKHVMNNEYNEIFNLLEGGVKIYKNSTDNINFNNPTIDNINFGCCNKRCNNIDCKNRCYKSSLYYAINNTNRGIKTVYHLLLKLLIINPKLRNLCKCCENLEHKKYLLYLEKNFINKKHNNNQQKLDNNIIFELKANYLINKFMSVLGLLPCECKFKNRYYKFYSENYLNFKDTIKIYMRTIPQIIKLLKIIFKLKDNNEELHLIKDSRCIHEDIRFYNLSYCNKKKDNKNNVNKNIKIITETIFYLEILNDWIINSIRISIHLYNQQSLEYFRFILSSNSKISSKFKKIYSKDNDIIDLNYSSNKKSIISSILEYTYFISTKKDKISQTLSIQKSLINKKTYDNNILELINVIINQLHYRNNNSLSDDKYDINEIILDYVIECLKNNNILLGLEFLKNINELIYKKEYEEKLEYIFNFIIENEFIYANIKVSYLKIINKKKINIIQYDFINKLIENELGDKIIIEFDKNENSFFNIIDNYKNKEYISETIKKCIINKKDNILDYILYNLDSYIKNYNINLVDLYIKNIMSKDEYNYIELLKIILKYVRSHDLNSISNDILSDISGINNNSLGMNKDIIFYCIDNKLTLSAKLFIKNNFLINIEEINKKLLLHCIEMQNHIIMGYIIEKNPIIIMNKYNNQNILNLLFNLYSNGKISNSNVLMRFIIKIVDPIINNKIKDNIINYQDISNELIGFKILKSNLKCSDKIILFNLLKNVINPILVNNFPSSNQNFPLILYSVLLDEYEMTYIMLNNLFKNNIIYKENKDLEENTIFDYSFNPSEISNSLININFIPVIFKFIKDNEEKHKYFKENVLLLSLEIDSYMIKYIVICIQCIIYMLSINNNLYLNKYKEKSDTGMININLSDENCEESNKYIELSCDQNIFKKYSNIELTTDDDFDNKINNIQTWTKSGIIKEEIYDSNSCSSEVEESDIIF